MIQKPSPIRMIDSEGGAFGFDCYLASPEFRVFQQPVRRVDGLEPLMLAFPTSGRQAIFLGATGPRATRPEETRRGATLVGQGWLAVSTVGKVRRQLTRADSAQTIPTCDCRDYRRHVARSAQSHRPFIAYLVSACWWLSVPRGRPPPMQVKKASDRLPAHDVDDRISNGWQSCPLTI